jgi:hypothetical protein
MVRSRFFVRITGLIKRLRMVTPESGIKLADPGLNGPDACQTGYGPAFPIKNPPIKWTQGKYTMTQSPCQKSHGSMGPYWGQRGHRESGQMRHERDINRTNATQAMMPRGITCGCGVR